MNITFKNKLYLGLGVLTLLILLLWISSMIFFNNLSDTSAAIIRNNSRSVVYMQNIQQTMKEFYLLQTSATNSQEPVLALQALKVDSLKNHLLVQMEKEMQNITEPPEGKLARRLQIAILTYLNQFGQLMNREDVSQELRRAITHQYALIQHLLGTIISANVEGMYRKNEFTQKTASNIILYMAVIGAICILLAIGLLLRYPGYIVKPIDELIARINKIANQNYDQRLEFEIGDEFEDLAQAFNSMAGRLQEYETSNLAKLKNEKQRIEAIIDHMYDAVIGLDTDKHILFINTKAEELMELKNKDIEGRYAPDIATDNDLLRMLIRDLMDSEKPAGPKKESTDFLEIDDGDQKDYYSKETIPVISASVKELNKREVGTIIILKNVTRFREMDEAKTNFIAVASHELKTPISSIKMSLRLLRDERVGRLNDEQKKLVNSIKDDAGRMKKSTDDLLDLSKIETGNIHINVQQADPTVLIKRARQTMRRQARQKDISIEVESQNKLPKVNTDIQKTVWVLVNLIANAIRYSSSKGQIKLNAERINGVVRFTVTDTGQGISPEYQDKIFDKYFQVYNTQNGSEGSGLGLAIAKEFINAQGGEIGVNSEIGEGSCFHFTLPVIKKVNRYEA